MEKTGDEQPQPEEEAPRDRLEREKLTAADVDKLYDLVMVSAEILEMHGIRYTMEGGTLLGAVRNGGLIKHDNDADFDVLQTDLARILALRPLFESYGVELIETPGWGLQVAHMNSPSLAPGMWTNGEQSWTSRWPFLDLIALEWVEDGVAGDGGYFLAQDVARQDYPDYHLTRSDWEQPFERIAFGHLKLWAIGTEKARHGYLDRSYKDWGKVIEMNMDHRTNRYFDKKIEMAIGDADLDYRPRSDAPTTLAKPWPPGQ
jgi:lipopolysaccharide cholinephosphotransferase